MEVIVNVAGVLFALGLAAAGGALTVAAIWAVSSDERAEKAERWIRRWKERGR